MKYCYWVCAESYIEGEGWRLSVVERSSPGHSLTGTWPYDGKSGQQMPIFARVETFDEAKEVVEVLNDNIGVSSRLAAIIVASSMATQNRS